MDENRGKRLLLVNFDLFGNLMRKLESFGRVEDIDFVKGSNCLFVEFSNEASAAACKLDLNGRINVIQGKCEVEYAFRNQPREIPAPMAGEGSSGSRQQMMIEQVLGRGSGLRSRSNMAPMSGADLGSPMGLYRGSDMRSPAIVGSVFPPPSNVAPGLDLGLAPPMSASHSGSQTVTGRGLNRGFEGQMITPYIRPQTTTGPERHRGSGGLMSSSDLRNQPTTEPGLNLAVGCAKCGCYLGSLALMVQASNTNHQTPTSGSHSQTPVRSPMTTPSIVVPGVRGSSQHMEAHLSGNQGQAAAPNPRQSGKRSRGSSREEQRVRSSPRLLGVEEQRSRSRAAEEGTSGAADCGVDGDGYQQKRS